MSKPKDDLISRSAAIEELMSWVDHEHEMIHWTGIKAMLECLPAVDAVPVIRCLDCKFYHGVNEECGCNGGYHSEDWFCADGERRDDDATLD